MKIDRHKRRTEHMPLVGVTFTKDERAEANDIARVLVGLPFATLSVMRSALARRSLYLEEVSDWTEGDSEAQRREEHERTLITYYAAEMACHRVDA